jgi:hypothetical protein
MSEYKEDLDMMTFSFSRVNSFTQCRYQWYLKYIEKRDGIQNFYAAFGKFCHEILEMYANGELTKEEMPRYYEEYYQDKVVDCIIDTQEKQVDKYFELGLSYFSDCDLDLDRYEILGIELKCEFEVNGIPFLGYIDLLLRDKDTQEIILIDHKSSEYPLGKRGKVKKAKEQNYLDYKRQLYLYCIDVKNNYGVFPDKLAWNYFKEKQWLIIPFIQEEFDEAKQWVSDTISQIYDETDYDANQQYFYCNNLCEFRYDCEYKDYKGSD